MNEQKQEERRVRDQSHGQTELEARLGSGLKESVRAV